MSIPKVNKNTTLLLSAVVLVLVVIMGYVTYTRRASVSKPKVDSSIQKLQEQSSSTEVSSIEKDILDTDLSDLDKELEDIEQELNQAYY